MKILTLLGAILLAPVLLAAATLEINTPVSGRTFKQNGRLDITWTVTGILTLSIYVDHYENEVLIESYFIYKSDVDEGWSGISADVSHIGLVPGTYRVRLEGTSQDGTTITVQNHGVFTITGEGVVSCEPTDALWIQGESQEFTLKWAQVHLNTRYEIHLVNVSEYIGECSFVLGFGTIMENSGQTSFTSPTLSTNMSGCPEYFITTPVSGYYRVMLWDPDTYTRYWSRTTIYFVADDVIVSAAPRDQFLTLRTGESDWYLKINVDARYSSSDLNSLTVPLSFWIEEPDTVLLVSLLDANGRKISPNRVVRKALKYEEFALRSVARVQKGSNEDIYLVCRAIRGHGRFDASLTKNVEGAAFSKRGIPLTSHFIPQWGNGAEIIRRRRE